MFCKKCGAKIDDDSTFCPKCGTSQQDSVIAVQNGVTSAVLLKEQERAAILADINGSFEVMTALKRAEDEILTLEEPLPKLEKKASNSTRNGLFAGAAIFMFPDILLLSSGLFDITFLIIGAIIIAAAIHQQKSNRKKIAEIQQKIQIKQSEIETLKGDAALVWLPYDYRNSTYFALIYGYIMNMRANNLTEAINLLETELHQARVELMSSVAAQASVDAANSANAAAGAAAASAFFSLFK